MKGKKIDFWEFPPEVWPIYIPGSSNALHTGAAADHGEGGVNRKEVGEGAQKSVCAGYP
ncbi:MAG TPA: hypothetical protein VN446_09675 [Candidatus Acidoferrum sp.]|nr:hypothetical protein [Candidatus Acidoferrum sp.]